MLTRKKVKKEPAPWRRNILAHHQDRPSAADRNEFPTKIVKELIFETGGLCQCGCGQIADTTHHVMPRGRSGRGVKTNGMRLNGKCHDRIQTNEAELQYWIAVWEKRYGPYFWFDELDWIEHRKRMEAERAIEEQKLQRAQALKPIHELFAGWAGRPLEIHETNLINRAFGDTRSIELITKVICSINKSNERGKSSE
ncbi:HNH endonuclease [Paenibacillus sp. 32352]|uniref:HNH endonuclease n=1 Tax=Paenibacillus sp. 32352 TaxID=1969111 RepID=UPI0009ACA721|nr:HNH endonuclease [Paenibacillus sp. 32352]